MIFIGPFPGPVTGQTVMTRFLHDQLAAQGDVRAHDVVRGDTGTGWRNSVIKAGRALRAVAGTLRHGRGQICYISLDANRGMWLTVIYAAAARLAGATPAIHHHSYSHLARPFRPMAVLARVAGPAATHVTICPAMSADLVRLYPRVRRTLALSNICSLSALPETPRGPGPLRLGHMSKLGAAKGTWDAIAALDALLAQGIDATLTLAGAPEDAAAAATLADHAARLGDRLVLAGLVRGAAKTAFLQDLDLFLFPTRYANETQGIVNLEALSAGVPVVAFGRCCITSDLGGLPGWVVPVDGDFTGAVLALAGDGTPASLAPLRRMARRRFETLAATAADDLAALVRLCHGPQV